MSSPSNDSKPDIKFYSPKRLKYSPGEPGYEELLPMFRDGLPIPLIAEKVGLSRGHLRTIYKVYFKDWLSGSKANPAMQRKYTIKDRRKKILDGVFVNRILPILTSRGYDCEFADNDIRDFHINGYKCRFYKCSNARYIGLGSKSRHSTVGFTYLRLLSNEFVIVLQDIEGEFSRVYVIPAIVVLRNFSLNKYAGTIRIRLPVEGTSGYNKPRVDWTKYLDAWELLKVSTVNKQKAV